MLKAKNPYADISEKAFRQQVIDLAKIFGYKCYFSWTSIHSPRGFPDLVLCKDRVVFAELKTEIGKTSPYQDEWIDALTRAGQEVYLWRPSQIEQIAEILRGK